MLDLRQNPGGLLEQAVEVANLFIRKGTLVVTEADALAGASNPEALRMNLQGIFLDESRRILTT